jgi:hypothetical protein
MAEDTAEEPCRAPQGAAGSNSCCYEITIDRCDLPESFDDIEFADVAQRSMSIPNAGGSSNISEALSMEYMRRRFDAVDFVPEMEVVYWCDACLCDFLMILPGENVGVSVTRAVSYPFDAEYTMEHARELLNRKLYKLMVARNAISEEQSFYRSVLHVWCYTEQVASCIRRAHGEMVEADADRTYDSVHVICTVCDRMYIYTNRPVQRDA